MKTAKPHWAGLLDGRCVDKQCLVQDHHILARKYADRWLRRVLNEGLYGRPLQRVEVPQDKPILRAVTLGAYHKSAESKVNLETGKHAHLVSMQAISLF